MRIDRLRRGSGPASRQVYRALRDAIIATDLEPGQRISENELAERLAVSRTPVREALIRLRDERFVQIVPQLGTFVTRISAAAVQDAQFIRESLECAAVRLAATRADDGDIAALGGLVLRQAEVSEHGEAVVVAVPADLGLAAHQAGERRDVAVLRARRREPHGRAFQRFADELGILDRRHADPRDERAELGHDLHEALIAQADQRLADRRAADGQSLGELVLRDPLPRLELGRDDRVAQRAVGLPARGAPRAAPQTVDAHVGHSCILTYKLAEWAALR
jgi:DNA-binding FadR family transcriptional regulator